ncbi:MAG: hypothetical protein WCS70_01930 [Verrucomicrobiota bacterium]
MNKFVSTMVAGAAALAIAGSASAQTVTLRITGSTAFRGATHNAILAMLQTNRVYGYAGTSFTGAGQAQFIGTTIVGNIPVIIKTSWAGSVGGIQTLTQNRTDGSNTKWMNNDASLTVGGASGLSSGPYDAPVTADVAMSDTFQGQTPYTSPTLTKVTVGVVPFAWVRNTGCPSGVDNMTTLQAQLFLASGSLPIGLFTGNTNDTVIVSLIGRDQDSGTRVVSFAEPAFGVFSAPFQNQLAVNGVFGANGSTTNSITGIQPYPDTTVLGDFYASPTAGYASGGTVAGLLRTPNALTGAGTHIIGYVGISDANTATNGASGAAYMKYNGVDYSEDAVRAGKYTFWSYEHLMYRSSLTGNSKTVADTLANTIKTVNISPAGIHLGTMGVSRQGEGLVVSP